MLLTFHIHLYNDALVEANFWSWWDRWKGKFDKYVVVKEYSSTKECHHYQGYFSYPECKAAQGKEIKVIRKELKELILKEKYRKQDTAISPVKKTEEAMLKYILKGVVDYKDILDKKGLEDTYLRSFFGGRKEEAPDWRKALSKYVRENSHLFLRRRKEELDNHVIEHEYLITEKLFEVICHYYKGDIYERDLIRRYDYILYQYSPEGYIGNIQSNFFRYRTFPEIYIPIYNIETNGISQADIQEEGFQGEENV